MRHYAWCLLFDSAPYQEGMLDRLGERVFNMVGALPVGFSTDVQRMALNVRPVNFRDWFDTLLPFCEYAKTLLTR